MKTIAIEHIEETVEAADCIVPARSSRLFMTALDVDLTLKHVSAVGRHASLSSEDCPLRVTEVHVVDLNVADGIHLVHPVHADGRIEGLRALRARETFLVRVENASVEPWAARPVATGVIVEGTPSSEEAFVAFRPRPDVRKTRRLYVKAKTTFNFKHDMPCDCMIREITTRSDAEHDVAFGDIRVGNDSTVVSGAPVPVEFFEGGRAVRLPRARAGTSFNGTLINSGESDRYVEIDVGISSVDLGSAEKGRATPN